MVKDLLLNANSDEGMNSCTEETIIQPYYNCNGKEIQMQEPVMMPSETSIGDQCVVIRFDPNDVKYRCFCKQCHATTGVRIIAGMLCVTVVLELWHFVVTAVSTGNSAALVASASQLLIGAAIAWTLIYALWTEKAGYLLPYLVLQSVGLAAGTVFLITFLYISLFGNTDTMLNWMETQGHVMDATARHDFESQFGYVSWLLVVSFVLVVVLQVWLISIVFACWRYFRGKRVHGYIGSYGSMSYVIFGDDRNATSPMLNQVQTQNGQLPHATLNSDQGACEQLQQQDEIEDDFNDEDSETPSSYHVALSMKERAMRNVRRDSY